MSTYRIGIYTTDKEKLIGFAANSKNHSGSCLIEWTDNTQSGDVTLEVARIMAQILPVGLYYHIVTENSGYEGPSWVQVD